MKYLRLFEFFKNYLQKFWGAIEKRSGKIDPTIKFILQREDFNSILPFTGVSCDNDSLKSFLTDLQDTVKNMNDAELMHIDTRDQSKDNFIFNLGQRKTIEGILKLINTAHNGHDPSLLSNLTGNQQQNSISSLSSANSSIFDQSTSSSSSSQSSRDQNSSTITPDNFFQKIVDYITSKINDNITEINISSRKADKYPLSAIVWCYKCSSHGQKVNVYQDKRKSGSYTRFRHLDTIVEHIKQCNANTEELMNDEH